MMEIEITKKEKINIDALIESLKFFKYTEGLNETQKQITDTACDVIECLSETYCTPNDNYEEKWKIESPVLENPRRRDCETCRYASVERPHTCDLCTSLDNDEVYGMWKARIKESENVWISCFEQRPKKSGRYLAQLRSEEDEVSLHVLRYVEKEDKWYFDGDDEVDEERFIVVGYCVPVEPIWL